MSTERILEISFGWGVKWTPDEVLRLSQVTGEECRLSEDGTLNYTHQDQKMTLTEVLSFGKEFTVKKRLPFARITEELDEFQPRPQAPAPLNARCNVIVGGTSVMEIKEVKVCTDFCTEALQDELNYGWRILAICVQPNQRRPDYVLGKV